MGMRDRLRSLLTGRGPQAQGRPACGAPANRQNQSITPSRQPPLEPSSHSTSTLSKEKISRGSGASKQPNSVDGDAISLKLLYQALELLPQDERSVIQKHISPVSDNVESVLLAVFEAAQNARAVCETKRWTFAFHGHTVRLRDEVEKLIQWLDRFKQAGDVAVTVDPMHAGLPWALVRFLLEGVVSDYRQLAALLVGLRVVLTVIHRLKVYLDYLGDVPVSSARTNFEVSLTELLAIILQFLTRAIKIFNESTVSRTFNAFWKPQEVTNFESDCAKIETRVELEARNCDRLFSRGDRAAAAQLAEQFKELQRKLEELQSIKSQIDGIEVQTAKLWESTLQDKQTEILDWTSNIPYLDNHRTASKGRVETTGEWIYHRRQFQEWDKSKQSMILWLHGIPGAGKTKLISNVIDRFLGRPGDEALAYFYCDRNDDSRRHPEEILRSFVKQLSMSHDGQGIQDSLVETYQQKQRTGFASARITCEEAESLLPTLIQAYSRTTLVLDALDECLENSRLEFIEILGRLAHESPGLKILISSRRDQDIKLQLEKKNNIGIEASDNEKDICEFVVAKIYENQHRRRRQLSDALRKRIVDELLKKSQGMFQWASLQISQLLSLDRESDIESRLGKLPRGLTKAYDEIYSDIQAQEGSKPIIATRAFQWLMSSVEPLTDDALVAAVCQDGDLDEPRAVDIDIDFILDACKNLVMVDQTRVCRFCHLSVQEYFEERRYWTPEQANELVAKVYLALLNHPSSWEMRLQGTKTDGTDKAKILAYARTFWFIQVQNTKGNANDGRITDLLRKFFGSAEISGPGYRSWFWSTNVCSENVLYSVCRRRYHLDPPDSPMPAISFYGFKDMLMEMAEMGNVNPDLRSSGGYSLLSLAAIGGHKDIAKLLLQMGAHINAQLTGLYCNALEAAVSGSDKGMVELLLQNGADIDAQLSRTYGSALAAAAVAAGSGAVSGSRKAILKLLLKYGADINAKLPGQYGSTLAAAAACNVGKSTIEFLLDKGADVNLQLPGQYGSALVAAASRGREAIIELLLQHGANVNATLPGKYGTALAAAAYWDHVAVVEFLLQRGADTNTKQSGTYGSALAAAAAGRQAGHENIVVLLLQHGADVNAQLSGAYGSALATAAYKGNVEIVRLLLQHGADVDARLRGRYGSALAAAKAGASFRERRVIVEVLLQHSKNVISERAYDIP